MISSTFRFSINTLSVTHTENVATYQLDAKIMYVHTFVVTEIVACAI